MKLAKAQLLQLKSKKADILSYVANCFDPQSDPRSEISQKFEIALLIQAAAEKVSNHQFVYARKLLSRCDLSASKSGNPVQRIVYYFSEALKEKIDNEWGIVSSVDLESKLKKAMDVEQAQIQLQPVMMGCQQELPFRLVAQFAVCQLILDSVESAKKVHLIDFGIDNGSHWTLIMQSFATRYKCPLELLKVTAVGTCKQMLEETGKWLSGFAETINLPFSYNIVVSDLKDLQKDSFELEADEVVAVFLGMRLWTLLAWPNHLEALIGVIKKLKASAIVVKEIEASTNLPIFVERFGEAILLMSALFDCTKACMDHQILYRKMTEEIIFREMIRNIVIAEGTERIHRHERIGFWRALFARFGMVEMEFSSSSLCQATLLLKRSSRFSSCTMDMNGKCLIMGWKGTAFMSLSAWMNENKSANSLS
ncbi:hypothetical protein ACH5RR_031022 [Cinchona calisaya]|uniref:Uncharacterized protein n=1 Tax=Cinchona calisaya TaxID=153742 RepID=A0ABD2YE58_9GENT